MLTQHLYHPNTTILMLQVQQEFQQRKHLANLNVMKCIKKLDEWLFLHTGKAGLYVTVHLVLRFLPTLGKQWLDQSLSATELCKSCFNKPPLVGNFIIAVYCQVCNSFVVNGKATQVDMAVVHINFQ